MNAKCSQSTSTSGICDIASIISSAHSHTHTHVLVTANNRAHQQLYYAEMTEYYSLAIKKKKNHVSRLKELHLFVWIFVFVFSGSMKETLRGSSSKKKLESATINSLSTFSHKRTICARRIRFFLPPFECSFKCSPIKVVGAMQLFRYSRNLM